MAYDQQLPHLQLTRATRENVFLAGLTWLALHENMQSLGVNISIFTEMHIANTVTELQEMYLKLFVILVCL